MNSIKNTIVTVTLLAVSYGAYVVLSNPPAEQPELGMTSSEPETFDVDVTIPDDNVDSVDSQFPAFPEEQDVPQPIDPPPATATASADWSDPFPPASGDMAANELPQGEPNANDYAAVDSQLPADNASAEAGYYSADVADYPNTEMPDIPASTDNAVDDSSVYSAAASNNGFEEAWKLAQSSINHGKLDDALKTLSIWYNEPSLSTEQAQRCVQALDELAGSVIYSQESFMEPAYVVQEGETLDIVAQKYSVPPEFLARINGVEAPYELYPGESLKVVKGPFRAEVSPDQSEITIFLGRSYAGRFPARMGTDLPEADGEFEVVAKEPGREYFDRRTGYRVNRDDPSNPYGNRWIGLRGEQVTAAHNVGIHVDTGSPESGCIAVSSVDADDITAILSIGSRVTIRR